MKAVEAVLALTLKRPATIVLACLCASSALAESAQRLVEDGNRAYDAGRYDEAIDAYEEATVSEPESPQIYFNKGTAYYRQEEYAKAKDAFEAAALKSKNLSLEAQSNFNLGNCAFREGKRQQDSDIEKTLAELETSVRYYRRALELDPEMTDAAHNIEVARLTMKVILDEIKRQQEAAEQQQQQQEQAQQALEELIERQQELQNQTEQLSKDQAREGSTPENEDRKNELAGEQGQTREDTQALSDKMGEQQPNQPSPSPMDQAKEHVDRATGHQADAEKELKQGQAAQAQASQDEAIEELEKARDSLNNPDQSGEQQQQDSDSQDQQQNEQQQNEQQAQQQESQQQQEGKPEEMAGTPRDETARDILNEEQENRRRRTLAVGRYAPVDKDW